MKSKPSKLLSNYISGKVEITWSYKQTGTHRNGFKQQKLKIKWSNGCI